LETLSLDHFNALKVRLALTNSLSLTVLTDSMAPLIKPGTSVTVCPLTEDPEPGSIILFLQNDRLICHMVKKQNSRLQPGFVICGGLKKGFDLPVEPDRILGKVVSHKIGLKEILYITFAQLGLIR